MNTTYFKYLLLPAALLSTVSFAQELDEEDAAQKVNVAFRSVPQEDLLGGVSVLDYEELAAKNNNTYSLDNMQGYVSGFNGASLWGQTDYLVLVDGVPRDADNVKPDEIAQVTFMKGAQAVVLYGSRAAKGVILITTKRGNDQDLQIKVSANTGWNVAKSFPEYLGAAEYMTLYNEALVNDGNARKYSDEAIYNTYAGVNPYRYPNINLYSSDYLKKAYNRSEVVAEFRGGAKRTHYYTNIGYMRSGDNLNYGNTKDDYTDRLNVRGNVDMQMADWISAFADANVTFYSARSAANTDFWEAAESLRPNRVVGFIPMTYLDPLNPTTSDLMSTARLFDGAFIGAPSDPVESEYTNVIANGFAAGTSKYNSRHFEFSLGINLDLDRVTKGLSFSTMFAVDYATAYSTSYTDTYAIYIPQWGNYNGQEVITSLVKQNKDQHTGVQGVGGSTYKQTIDFNAHFDYNRTFADVHNVSAMLLANGYQQSQSGEYHRTSNVNAGLLASYNYAHKYYAEFGSALIHSAKLAEGNRKGYSYSATAGWNIAREAFLEGSIFDDLKLSASYSVLSQDIDVENYGMYAPDFNNNHDVWWGWGVGDSQQATTSKRGSNKDLDYIKRKEFSVTLQGALLEKALTFEASYFRTTTEGLIIVPNNLYPSYFSTYWPEASFVPYTNYNNDLRYGFEVAVNYKKQLTDDWMVGVGANMTWYDTEATKRDDSQFADAYQYRQGTQLDAIWGYECLGLFKSDDEVTGAPEQKLGENPKAGDLRYKDQNGDGVIDNKDQVNLGRGGWYGSPLTLGANLTLKYKGLSLFVLATGSFGGQAVKNNSYWWVHGDSKYSAVVRDRAIVDPATRQVTNASSATYPRLTTGSGANNFVTSDYWLYDTDQINLQKVQITYDFPASMFEGSKVVKGISLFANGNNLLKIAKEKELLEMNVGSAPQNRFYQIGASVKF